jgi:pheromone shutdown protein TraB
VDGVDDLAADEEVKEINSVSELPVTTTELVAPNGVKVYVVGTAHFSVKSQQDVIETIQKVQPNVVVLELCQSRRNILTLDEETILREASDLNFEKVRLAIRQSGAVQGMLHLLLLSMSAQITKKLGMAPGGEFRVGLHEASKIHNCMIYLGDRSFGITLSRALNALTLKQKIKLCWQFMTNNEDITKEEIERCKEKDLLEKMLIEMMGEYPSISQVFVHERDLYLAHSLWGAALSAHASVCHNRDHGHPLGSETGAVVGVVGMGHVAGIIKHWGKTTEEQISEITIVPEPSLQSRIIRKTIKISFYALLGYGTFKLSRKLFDFPSDALISRTVKGVPELVNKPLNMFRK